MKFKILKATLAGAVTAAFAGGGIIAMAGAASAAPNAPSWEPDTNAASPYGNVAFYDANGVQVTSGTNLASPFAYAVATTAADSGATKAIVNFYNPQHGVTPTNWTGTSETGTTTFSPASSLPAGTPANVVASAPTNPVVAFAGTGNITTWLASNTPDTTAGFANTIQVRLTDSGPLGAGNAAGTYWETDIGYNTSSAPITVDGTTVPANGWAQLFPFTQAASTTPLAVTTSASGGTLTTGSSLTVTATGVPATPAGTVVFEDNGALLGDVTATGGTAVFPATGTYTPAGGSHSYSAFFVPAVNETSPNTTSATMVTPVGSNSASVTVSTPKVNTSTSLSAGSTSINFGQSDTLTATVTGSDGLAAGVAGSVQFQIGGSNFSSAVPTTVSGTTGTAVLTTTTLPTGTDSVTAVFSPTDSTAYNGSTSSPVVITVAAPAACSLTGSVCSDQQNIQVTVNPGTITISTPYTASNPFVLPAMTLSTDGTYLQSSATFPSSSLPNSQQIVVTSNLAPAYAWTLSVAATPLTSTGGHHPGVGSGSDGGHPAQRHGRRGIRGGGDVHQHRGAQPQPHRH